MKQERLPKLLLLLEIM